MWKSLTGRSSDRSEHRDPQVTTNGKRSSRSRTDSLPTSSSTRKSSKPEGKRGYDEEQAVYSSTPHAPSVALTATSAPSSYVTADTGVKRAQLPTDTYGIEGVPSRYSNSKTAEVDGYERKSRRGRKDSSGSRERKESNVSLKGSRGREDREKREPKPKRRETLQDYDRKESESSVTRKSKSSRSSKPSRAATMPVGSRGIEDEDSHFQHQFSGQTPISSDPSHQSLGLAADYYGDHGESVADQPGVRPVAPSIILGPDTHLHEPTVDAAPPVEPSATGQLGAAASFYANHSDQENSAQTNGNGRPPKPTASVSYGVPSPRASPGPTPSPGSAVPPTSGLSASYYHPDTSNSNSQVGYGQQSSGFGASDHMPPQQPERPTKPGKWSSSGSNIPWVGAAAAAGAYGLYNQSQSHENHYEHHNAQHGNGYGGPLAVGLHKPPITQKHRHRGPLGKLVEFFKDPEGVGQYEEYTEYLGVCKYCFEPGSSSRDAPRKHHHKRRLSGGGRHGSSTRVDKLNRYASSEDEKRKKSRGKGSWVAAGAAGAAGYGLSQAGKSLANRKNFDDTYGVQSGRPMDDGFNSSRRDHEHDRVRKRSGRDHTEYGITGVSSRMDSSHPYERRSGVLHDVPTEEVFADDRRPARRKSPRRSTHARISPKSSYVSLTNEGPPGYSSFFSAPSANQQRHRTKKKGFFTFNNSSSSSSDADLAFGAGHVRRKDSKRAGRPRNDNFDLNATVLGLGAATAALAAANSRQTRGRKHGADLVAVKETKAKHRKGTERRHRRGSRSSESGPDSAWEDASDVDSDAGSALAYGLAERQSRESLASNGSGTEKWAWRWGSKKSKKSERDSRSRPQYGVHSPEAGPDHERYTNSGFPERQTESAVSASSLQQVYPVPTNDPNVFDVARKSSVSSSQHPLGGVPYVSQAASVPLKQPQPITPVTAVLNGNQGPDVDGFDRRGNRETLRHDSRRPTSGQFLPNQTISESPPQVLSNGAQSSQGNGKRVSWSLTESKEPRRPDNVNINGPLQRNDEAFANHEDSTRERPSGVSFSLPEKELEKELERERRAKRRRAERRRADSYGSDHANVEEDRSRRPRRGSHSDEERSDHKRFSDTSTGGPRRKSEENLAREEELEREIMQLVEEDQSNYGKGDKKTSSPWVAPAAAGAVGAGFAAAAIHAMSKTDRSDKERQREVQTERDHSDTASNVDSGPEDDRYRSPDRRTRRTGKIKLPRSTSSPVYDKYESYFTPPELAEHLKEHNTASERRNSTDGRTSTIPQIVEVVPASPSNFPVFLYEPFGSRAEHNADLLYQPIPRLRLMEPSPPVSIAGSIKGDASPTIIAVDPDVEFPEELEESSSHKKEENNVQPHHMDAVNDETESPFVDRSKKPSRHVEMSTPQATSIPDEPLSPKTRAVDEADEIPRQSPDRDHGVDLAFAAALAAGAQDAGFDPSIVIDDPTYHRRDSPPGSDKGKIYQAPFAETVSDLALEMGTSSVPAQVGFVEGEVESPDVEVGKVSKDPEPLERKPEKHSSQASHESVADNASVARKISPSGRKHQASKPRIPGDFNVFDYMEEESPGAHVEAVPNNVDSMSADEVLSRVSWSSPKVSKNINQDEDVEEFERKADSPEPSDHEDTQIDREVEIEKPSDTKAKSQKDPDDFYQILSSKKSKRKSKRDSVGRDEPRGFADVVDETTKNRIKPEPDNDPVQDDVSVAASTPAMDLSSEPGRTRRKSKKERRSAKRADDDFEEKMSTTSSPAKISNEKESPRSGKDKTSSGIFSIFGAAQALSAQKDSRAVDDGTQTARANEASFDDFETPKKKSKKNSKKDKPRESSLDLNDVPDEDQPREPQTSSQDETVSFLGERPEMPLKGDNGASGHSSSPVGSERGGQVFSATLSEDFASKPSFHVRSRSASPRPTDRNVELQPISFSRSSSPSTPQNRDTLRQRRLSALQIGEPTTNPLANSSPTAVPLTFRRPPISPSHARQASASSPVNESPSSPHGVVRSRQPRPNSTEFKSSKEFRPLFLVERHSYKQEPETTETYPSLPSSRTSSAHPSIEDLRNARQESTPQEPLDWFGQPPKGDKKRSWSSLRDHSPDYLDSQQTTPTGTEFPEEVKKPKPKYEFHSPSELLHDESAQHGADVPPMSPILLPKSMSSESLEQHHQPQIENPESSREMTADNSSSSKQLASLENDAETRKSIGLTAAAGAVGAATAVMASKSLGTAPADQQGQEEESSSKTSLKIGEWAKMRAPEESLDEAVAVAGEDVPKTSLAHQTSPTTVSEKDTTETSQPVDFVQVADESRSSLYASASQESIPLKTLEERSDATRLQEPSDEVGQNSIPEISPLSLNTTNTPPLQGTEEKDPKAEQKFDLSSQGNLISDDVGPRTSSPHVHWPEESLTAERVEYDPLRSTQHLIGEGESKRGNKDLHSVQPETGDRSAQSLISLPESVPLPATNDSDLVEPMRFDGSGAKNSPLTVAFERAKAVRGLPVDSDVQSQGEFSEADALRKHHLHQSDVMTIEHPRDASPTMSLEKEIHLASLLPKPGESEAKKSEKEVSTAQPDDPAPGPKGLERVKETDLLEKDQRPNMPSREISLDDSATSGPTAVSDVTAVEGAMEEGASNVSPNLRTGKNVSTREPVDTEPLQEVIIPEERKAFKTSESTHDPVDPLITEGQDPMDAAREPDMLFSSVTGKKGKKKMSMGKSTSATTEAEPSEPETLDRVSSKDQGAEVVLSRGASQEEPSLRAEHQTSVPATATMDQQKDDDLVDWLPAGKKGRKGKKVKGKQRAGSLLDESISLGPPRTSDKVDQQAEASSSGPILEGESVLELPMSSQKDQEDKPDKEYSQSTHWPNDDKTSLRRTMMSQEREVVQIDEKQPREATLPESDQLTLLERPAEQFEWAPISKGKKGKKKRQSVPVVLHDSPIGQASEKVEPSISEEAPSVPEVRPVPSRKQSKKDKKKKKAFIAWDSEEDAGKDVPQPTYTAEDGVAQKSLGPSQVIHEETATHDNFSRDPVKELGDSKNTSTKLETLEQDLQLQGSSKDLFKDASNDAILGAERASPMADHDTFKATDVNDIESPKVTEETPIRDEISQTSTIQDYDSVSQPAKSDRAIAEHTSQYATETPVSAQDTETALATSPKGSEMTEEDRPLGAQAREHVPERLQKPEAVDSNILPPDKNRSDSVQSKIQYTKNQVHQTSNAEFEEPSKEAPKILENEELEALTFQTKKGKKGKKKKRQTIDWTEEPTEPSIATSTESLLPASQPNEKPSPKAELEEQTVESLLAKESQNWPLETPQEERSESDLWTTQAKATSGSDNDIESGKDHGVTAASHDDATIYKTMDKTMDHTVSHEATQPSLANVEKDPKHDVDADKTALSMKSLPTANDKGHVDHGDTPIAEAQPISQHSPVQAPFNVSGSLLEDQPVKEVTTMKQVEASSAQEEFQEIVEKPPQPEILSAEERRAGSDDLGPTPEQAQENSLPVVSGWVENGKDDDRQLSTVPQIETTEDTTSEDISNKRVFDIVSNNQEHRHGEVPALAVEADGWTELPETQTDGKKTRKSSSSGEIARPTVLEEHTSSPSSEQRDSLYEEIKIKEEQKKPSVETSRSQPSEEKFEVDLPETPLEETKRTLSEDNEIRETPPINVTREDSPQVVSEDAPPEKSPAHEEVISTKVNDMTDDSEMIEAQVQPESQPEEFLWTKTSKKGKKKGKGKVRLEDIESEVVRSDLKSESFPEERMISARTEEPSTDSPFQTEKREGLDILQAKMPGAFEDAEPRQPSSEVVTPGVEQLSTTQAGDFFEEGSSTKSKKKTLQKSTGEPPKEPTLDQSRQITFVEAEDNTPVITPVEAEEPEESYWSMPSKKKKNQKKKGQANVAAAASPREDILDNGKSKPEEKTSGTTSVLDEPSETRVEYAAKMQPKKGKKSKKAKMAEDESYEPGLSNNREFMEQATAPLDSSSRKPDDDEALSKPDDTAIEDDWAVKTKKGKMGKKKKLYFEEGLGESPQAEAEEVGASGDQLISPEARSGNARFHEPMERDLETTATEEAQNIPADDKTSLRDITESAYLPTATEPTESYVERVEAPFPDNIGQREDLVATPAAQRQDASIATRKTETEDPIWLAPMSRKQSKRDKKKGKKNLPVFITDAQPEERQREARIPELMEEEELRTPPEEPSAPFTSATEVEQSHGLTADPALFDARHTTEQDFGSAAAPEISAEGSVIRATADDAPKTSIGRDEKEVQIERSENSHSPNSERGENLSGLQRSPQDLAASIVLHPESATETIESQADNRGEKSWAKPIGAEKESTRDIGGSMLRRESSATSDYGQESFRPAHHVKPSIQKTIETLGASQRRSSSGQRRLSSPSAVRPFRDSAMHISDPLHIGDSMHQMNRDSGYAPSPIITNEVSNFHEQPSGQVTSSRPPRPITPTSSSEDLKNDARYRGTSKRSTSKGKPRAASAEAEGTINKDDDVELSPDYEFSVPRGLSGELGREKQPFTSSPPLSPRTKPLGTANNLPETPIHRKPSQIDSTSKDRSSGLFDSSPSMRTPDPGQTPQSHNKRMQKPVDSLHRSPSVHGRRSAELLKQHREDELKEHATGDRGDDGGQQSPTSPQARSIFSGPIEAETSHQKGSSPSHKSLGTIPEDASFSHHGPFDVPRGKQNESPSKGITESLFSQRPWPQLDEQREAVSFSPHQPSKPIGGHLPATPEESEDEGARDAELARKDAKSLGKRASFPTSASLQTTNIPAVASSSTHDPITGSGNEAARDMADVYDGWGASAGSPMSPSRPPSMRKRQSMQQIQDLEARVEQLASENRLLATAKITAEKNLEDFHFAQSRNENASQEALEMRDVKLDEQDNEIQKLKENLEWIQREVTRLKELNDGLTATNAALTASAATHDQVVSDLRNEHSLAQQRWQGSSRELEDLRNQHTQLSTGMEDIVRHEIEIAVADRDAEIKRLNDDLEIAKAKIRELQQQLLAGRSNDQFTPKDADYFENACQQLCQHVQAWVKRFSKYSDTRVCRLTSEVRDEQTVERFENAMLDDYDVNRYLADRVKRRDVFVSVMMQMIWNHVFIRYLFGMDREQRQKLKSLEKSLTDIGPPSAVRRWRSLTLTLLTQRESFKEQRAADTEAVVLDIYKTLAKFLPPPAHVEGQVVESLRNVMRVAVDLSIEMRKQRAEYTVLPPLQPEYDTNGDLARYIYFNAALMNERSGETTSNEALEANQAVVRIVLFPLVVKKGSDNGEGDVEDVVCPAQVLIAKPAKDKKVVRIQSGDRMSIDGGNRSVHSFAPSSMDIGNVI